MIVTKRDSKTLIPLIKNFFAQSSIIVTDKWKAYKQLIQCVYYTMLIINHSKEYAK